MALLGGCNGQPFPDVSGTYRNPCCATLTVRNGEIETPTRTISFTLDRDKIGVILLPDKYVGVLQGQGLDIDSSKYPMLIRYADDAGKPTLVLTGPDGDFIFERDR
ncbi:hypothetical protein ACLB0R_02775 [Sphingomonas sp. GlSt437]|uniref:hypothetical protein n=1 Tax=Sphingomonas sp. GlSt437 TaxID=3389970 RepID=UPI003EB94E20